MAELIAIVVVLWLLGIVNVPWLMRPHFPTLQIMGYPVTIETIIVIIALVWIASSLGGVIGKIVWVLVLLWLLSVLGVITVGGLSNLLVIGVVVGIVLSLVQK